VSKTCPVGARTVILDIVTGRLVRITIWALALLLSWLRFSTQEALKNCVRDGLDGVCDSSPYPLGDSLSRLLEGTSKILDPPSLRAVILVTQSKPDQTIPYQTTEDDFS